MDVQPTYGMWQNRQKRSVLVLLTTFLLVSATLGTDFLFARFHNTSFYASESLLFSSYWVLFLPLLAIQWKLGRQPIVKSLAFACAAVASHLLCYPALVCLLSKCFYHYTFSYWQTFQYELTAYSITTFIIYILASLIHAVLKNKIPGSAVVEKLQLPVRSFITSIIVSDTNNVKKAISTNEILYFSASSPYVNIHHSSKNYLHPETLKSLETRLDGHQFIRIHKSYLVNVYSVVSYQSRLNGDYDLTLTNGTILRVSRNYAAVFKERFEACHHLTAK